VFNVLGGTSRGRLRLLVATVVLAILAPAAGPALADSAYPILEISGDSHLLGEANDVSFDAYGLDAGGDTQALSIRTPAGYSASMIHAVGSNLGDAEVDVVRAGSTRITAYQGSLLVADPAGYAADTDAQACDSKPHVAVWSLSLANVAHGHLVIPVAVDRTGKGYTFTICFSAVQAIKREVSEIFFTMNGVFRNPSRHGVYLFDATVTPYAADGTGPDPSSSYELRGFELLPQTLTIDPQFDPSTKTLTVTGVLQANGRARSDTNVHIYAAKSANAVDWVEIGVAVTTRTGAYSFTKKFGNLQYTYVYAHVNHYSWPTCQGGSSLPGGCASYSWDGRSAYETKIATA
jgi:hypothetical protein